ncbi:hypothetical protein DL765_007520 [Monosporascus sp. GIB2]|nr:hypothetical protein DL765_007520 [Monosporascus sp. GIB2]
MWMLHAEVGLAFLSPLVCTLVVTTISSYLSKYLKSLQQTWLRSTAERSEYTLYVLRNMFGIKMSGMSGTISEVVLNYRDAEVEKSKQFRKMLSLLLTLGTTLATLATFAMISRHTGEELNATKVFTALATLQLPMSSLQTLISSVPLMGAAMASLQRIQEYLAQGDSPSAASNVLMLSDISGTHELQRSFEEMKGEVRPVFSIENGTIGWTSSTPLLRNVSFEVRPSEICFIFGQAGSGKSSLLDIIAGRAQALKSVTSITKDFTHAAYCEQSPWLPNDTIQNVIIGAERLDRAWFSQVLSLCCLTTDIACLEKGSDTLVGADGAGLSGGQKKRIALARAIYSRNRMFILDDPLGSLDANTKYLHHADRVFAIQGEELAEHSAHDGLAAGSSDNRFDLVACDQGSTSVKEKAGNNDVDSATIRDQIHERLTKVKTGPGPEASLEEHKLYVSSIGKKNFITFILLSASIAVASLARSFELKRISQYYSHDAYDHLGVYVGLVSGTLVLIFCWNWHFYIHGVGTSSTQLHKIQWDALIKQRTPDSTFILDSSIGKPPVIRNINLKIPHGQRVAICGRSGSGKTSLVSSIFNLLNVTSGNILISDLPTSNLCVQKLRENIAGLPQDTFFLPGSVRDNFRIYYNRDKRFSSSHLSHAAAEDGLTASMMDSLCALGLYQKIVAAGGLDCASIGLATLLSHGERQLFNLARLSITSSPIVVMDEATSSIDDKTERVARAFIRERFKGKTIVGVVHRLGSLVEDDWDSYVLMDGGRVVETGELREEGRGEKFVQLITGGGGS